MAFEDLLARANVVALDQLSDVSISWNGGSPIRVRWDRAYDDGLEVMSRETRFTGLAADFPGIAQDDSIENLKTGVLFNVHTVEPEDAGLVTCFLRIA